MELEKARKVSFEQAKAQYVHRYTMEHVPAWARQTAPNGRFYAPQFNSDREWYENTRFPGEAGCLAFGEGCYTTNQSFPMGEWLDRPLHLEGPARRLVAQ